MPGSLVDGIAAMLEIRYRVLTRPLTTIAENREGSACLAEDDSFRITEGSQTC